MSLALHVSGNKILDSNNNVVMLRGMGRIGFAPDGIWGDKGMNLGDFGYQWQPINSTLTNYIDQTFQCYQQVWHLNNVRIFFYPEWYFFDTVNPGGISTKQYIKTLVQEAAKYGIYVDLVPYQLTACSNSFSSDPYLTPNQGGGQGLPMAGFDTPGTNFINSTNMTESAFWTTFWKAIATDLGSYNNVIFEAWNEPAVTGNWGEPVNVNYQTYLKLMYNAVRSVSSNLILMQWEMGDTPGDNGGLSWAKTINTAVGGNPTNLAFTTHCYRYAPTNLSSYWKGVNVTTWLQQQIATMGVTAPLVINEAGSCLAYVPSSDLTNEYAWWTALNVACNSNGVGLTAYYWLSDADLGPVYAGETVATGPWPINASGPPPNQIGQIFINNAPAQPTGYSVTTNSKPEGITMSEVN